MLVSNSKRIKEAKIKISTIFALTFMIFSSFIVLCSVDSAYSDEASVGSLIYDFDDSNYTAKVVGVPSEFKNSDTLIVISEVRYGGDLYSVISIEAGAFVDYNKLKHIVLPDTITINPDVFEDFEMLSRVSVKGKDGSTVTDYSAILSVLPDVRVVHIDSPAEVDIGIVAGKSSLDTIIFSNIADNTVIASHLKFYDTSGNLLEDSKDLAGKKFFLNADDPDTWNEAICQPHNVADGGYGLIYASVTMVLLIVFFILVWAYRKR